MLTGDDLKKAGRWSLGRDPYLLETSAPGIFACGDVRLSPVKRGASGVGAVSWGTNRVDILTNVTGGAVQQGFANSSAWYGWYPL